jgi:predicted DNA binding CopG/RHH family protein
VLIVFTLRTHEGRIFIRPSVRASCTRRRSSIVKKPLPKLQADHEAERFVAEANLTEYGLSRLRTVQFRVLAKKANASTCEFQSGCSMPSKAAAASAGIPYQRFIRQTLEAAVQRPRRGT